MTIKQAFALFVMKTYSVALIMELNTVLLGFVAFVYKMNTVTFLLYQDVLINTIVYHVILTQTVIVSLEIKYVHMECVLNVKMIQIVQQ